MRLILISFIGSILVGCGFLDMPDDMKTTRDGVTRTGDQLAELIKRMGFMGGEMVITNNTLFDLRRGAKLSTATTNIERKDRADNYRQLDAISIFVHGHKESAILAMQALGLLMPLDHKSGIAIPVPPEDIWNVCLVGAGQGKSVQWSADKWVTPVGEDTYRILRLAAIKFLEILELKTLVQSLEKEERELLPQILNAITSVVGAREVENPQNFFVLPADFEKLGELDDEHKDIRTALYKLLLIEEGDRTDVQNTDVANHTDALYRFYAKYQREKTTDRLLNIANRANFSSQEHSELEDNIRHKLKIPVN